MGPYDGELRELCLLLKHERNAWLASWLSELFVEARRDVFSSLALGYSGCSGSTALVAAVASAGTTKPRRWPKVWRKQLKLPVRRLLKRVVGTRKLADLGRYRAE